ncbi:hypothetical protein BV25DRAFT_1153391 [Artomyces pyxidatus]|uniref:Uncharacterized protein n=1 Tax=Artomyces pyxidatus TaxID=48021 RepID=A0ACB8SSL6_9AGAM|nr:hypothetical protein BV25DRAFT_1153391 [Artomyces pyxidatus]
MGHSTTVFLTCLIFLDTYFAYSPCADTSTIPTLLWKINPVFTTVRGRLWCTAAYTYTESAFHLAYAILNTSTLLVFLVPALAVAEWLGTGADSPAVYDWLFAGSYSSRGAVI